jgi:hypothetical protein
MKIDIRKWYRSSKLNSHHDHSCNPEEQNVMAVKRNILQSNMVNRTTVHECQKKTVPGTEIYYSIERRKGKLRCGEAKIPCLQNS